MVARDPKATKRPWALIEGGPKAALKLLASVPSLATETRRLEGVQPAGAPTQVSRT